MAVRSKASDFDRSLAGIAGSDLAKGMDTSVLWVTVVLLGGGLCVGLITRPEQSYGVWYVWV